MNQYEDPAAPMRKGMSGGAKVAIGCGIVTIIVIILLCGGLIFGGWWALKQFEQRIEDYEAQGYTIIRGEMEVAEEMLPGPTGFLGQSWEVQAGSAGPLAMACQTAEINGTVAGKVEFVGNRIDIAPGAVIEGDLIIWGGQTVVLGEGAIVQGDIEVTLGIETLRISEGAQVWGVLSGNMGNVQKPAGWTEGKPSEAETGGEESGGEGDGGGG